MLRLCSESSSVEPARKRDTGSADSDKFKFRRWKVPTLTLFAVVTHLEFPLAGWHSSCEYDPYGPTPRCYPMRCSASVIEVNCAQKLKFLGSPSQLPHPSQRRDISYDSESMSKVSMCSLESLVKYHWQRLSDERSHVSTEGRLH